MEENFTLDLFYRKIPISDVSPHQVSIKDLYYSKIPISDVSSHQVSAEAFERYWKFNSFVSKILLI
jgi:hypothetical protein